MKQIKAKHKKDGGFFIRVENPASIRVCFLEGNKKVLQSMRLFQEFKEIRKEKIEHRKILRRTIKQISANLNMLKESLPFIDMALPKEKPSEDVEAEPEVKQEKPQTVDHIEAQLREIEQKLSSISKQ